LGVLAVVGECAFTGVNRGARFKGERDVQALEEWLMGQGFGRQLSHLFAAFRQGGQSE